MVAGDPVHAHTIHATPAPSQRRNATLKRPTRRFEQGACEACPHMTHSKIGFAEIACRRHNPRQIAQRQVEASNIERAPEDI